MSLVSILGKYDVKLKKYCKEQSKNADKSTKAMWVCDNYRLCSLPLRAAVRFLSSKKEKNLEPLFSLCKELFMYGEEINFDRIVCKLSSEKLDISQCEAVSILLYAAASAVLCDNLYEGNDDTAITCIKSIIKLGEIDFSSVLYEISAAERLLSSDPDGIYEKMSSNTKADYRKAVIGGAEKTHKKETEYLRDILAQAKKGENGHRHIGFYLPLKRPEKSRGKFFIFAEWLIALVFSLFAALELAGNVFLTPVFLFPCYAVIKPLSDCICSHVFPPFHLPELSGEHLTRGNTLITISTILPSASKTDKLFSHLSAVYSSNSLKNVKVMILADLKGGKMPELACDEADKAAMHRLIDSLNEKHGGGFCFALRDRVYSPFENEYTGYERKRGAIATLTRYLRGGNSGGFSEVYGDTDGIFDMKYILALDSDTELSFEALRQLLAAAEHPLNTPVYDKMKKRIVSGYGIFCPRNETSRESGEKTVFSDIFTNSGSVSYSPDIHERYMDLFGRGIFCGKGLINIDAYNKVCADTFEENRILSHDILEGAVLGAAFVPKCEFTDSFPSSPDAFLLRLNRWVRGDVQNLKYIFKPVGKKETAPEMTKIGKYQLFDNFRRAVSPVIAFLLMILSCFFETPYKNVFLFVSVLSVSAEYIFPVIKSFLFGGIKVFSTLYFSSEISSVQKDILRGILSIGFLPQNAITNADAIIKALYRSFISKRKLLQWTTAADGDLLKRKSIFMKYILPFSVFFIFFVFGTYIHRLFAFFILCFIPVYVFDGIKKSPKKEKRLGESEKEILTSFAASEWKFFASNVLSEEHFLPPDNIQETPVPRRATRTSPTNIGMYFVSILAAADFSFISTSEMFKRIEDTLSSVEKLPKYNGLLYNWYDTKTAQPLYPRYVSTVDCGNFLVCLTALKQGLKEYEKSFSCATELIKRIEKILDSSCLTLLYDKTRELFRIGIDCENSQASHSYYDMYMSEARMTSYYECAKRHVPVGHWNKLDRTLKRTSGYITASSWTGTMFEYFMPSLFLDTPEGTFSYEALKVCLYVQKKRAAKNGIPYGISESCYYETDNSLNYKYKAHGLKTLALKRNVDEESVISPYSVFLTLPFEKDKALKNLSELSALHTEGGFGFYEAVDFTKERTEGEHYAVVRCYMSHHIGMSLTAIANTVFDNIFVKRFMSDGDMSSARSLLNEKIPPHPTVTKFPTQKSSFETDGKKNYSRNRYAPEDGSETYAYSNGELTVFCDKYGRNRCVFGSYELYRFSRSSGGISVGAGLFENEEPISLFPENKKSEISLKKQALFSKYKSENIDITAALCVHPSENSLLIPVKTVNNGKTARKIKLCFYLEPMLLPFGKEDAHPTFSDMFTDVFMNEKNGTVTFFKKNDSSAPTVCIGFCGRNKFDYSFDRESILERNPDRKSVFDGNFRVEKSKRRGINPVLAISTTVNVSAGGKTECVLSLCVSFSRTQAESMPIMLRNSVLPDISKCAAATFLRDKVTFPEMCNYISRAFFMGEYSDKSKTARKNVTGGISSLWKIGLSGDRPIITAFPEDNCPTMLLKSFVRFFRRLVKCSIPADLVFIFGKSSEYGFSGEKELMRILSEEGVYDAFADKKGIYVFSDNMPSDSLAILKALSVIIYPEEYKKSVPLKFPTFSTENALPAVETENRFAENGFVINRHPDIPWCHTLSNSVFGTLVSDSSLGYSWALNSRQNKLTSWSNDTASDFTGERIFIEVDSELFNPLTFSNVYFSDKSAVYISRIGDILCRIEVSVAEKGMCKTVGVTLKNESDITHKIGIVYCVSPVLDEKREEAKFLNIRTTENGIFIKNPLNEDFSGVMLLISNGKNTLYGEYAPDGDESMKKMPSMLQKIALDNKKEYKTDFYMYFAASEKAVIKSASIRFPERKPKRVSFDTGYPQFDEFANALLYHQVYDTRINAKCGFYQCSGAFGFRDQLQDVLPLINVDNTKVKQMIYKAAAAQFPEGDVLHWFHIINGKHRIYKGVRSRCSDDKLWLSAVVGEYVNKTGDADILRRKIPYLKGEKLKDGEMQRYCEFTKSDISDTLYAHCLAAIASSLKTGEHSLPLFGSGDWNDSFDLVGINGKGESVWLGMFMRKVFSEFAKICDLMNDKKMSKYLIEYSDKLAAAIDSECWNGKWYIRGFYDDGSVLGDAGNTACETDILCQAWASLCDMPDKDRIKTALKSAYEKCVDEKNGTVALFTPAFTTEGKKTGYVNYYPSGMRENAGQYTHAAVWFLYALFKEGMSREAQKVLNIILPSQKYKDGLGNVYKTEPYALAGDVYTADSFKGRGGWSLYTGSAGWLMQTAQMLTEENRKKKTENR